MYSLSVQCEWKPLLLYADDSTIVASLWKGSRAKSGSFVGKISPGWTEISSNATQTSFKKLIIKKGGNSTFYLFACNDCQFSTHAKTKLCKGNKCLHLQREVRTSVIARQKFDYIFYSILRFNISYGSISVSGASDTQFIALRQGYDLSRLRVMKRLKTPIQLLEVSFLLLTMKQLYIFRREGSAKVAIGSGNIHGTLKEQFLHRIVFKCNLLWIDEYVMIDIKLSLYLHRQRNLYKQPPPHKLTLSPYRSLLFVPADSLNSLLCFFLFNTATSLQCSSSYFGASLNYENPRGNLFTMVMLFVNVGFLTIWVCLCYVMLCEKKLLWSYKSSIQIMSTQGFRVDGLFYVPRKVSQLRTKNKQRSCVSLCFLNI